MTTVDTCSIGTLETTAHYDDGAVGELGGVI
jgi:hypothetical protein